MEAYPEKEEKWLVVLCFLYGMWMGFAREIGESMKKVKG